jgi:predicted nucleic acid-binding protein
VAAITDDPDDNRILEAALAAKADAIVSGDKHLLDLGTWNGIPILSLADFLSRLK